MKNSTSASREKESAREGAAEAKIREKFVASGSQKSKASVAEAVRCPACGGEAVRPGARFCLTCGKSMEEGYRPLDSLRSSYRMQGRSFLMENRDSDEVERLFEANRNPVSQMTWACFVFSLVPYLGVLFIPFTFLIGIAGIGVYLRRRSVGGTRLIFASMGLSVPVFGVQVFLWWLLYIIPELGRNI